MRRYAERHKKDTERQTKNCTQARLAHNYVMQLKSFYEIYSQLKVLWTKIQSQTKGLRGISSRELILSFLNNESVVVEDDDDDDGNNDDVDGKDDLRTIYICLRKAARHRKS